MYLRIRLPSLLRFQNLLLISVMSFGFNVLVEGVHDDGEDYIQEEEGANDYKEDAEKNCHPSLRRVAEVVHDNSPPFQCNHHKNGIHCREKVVEVCDVEADQFKVGHPFCFMGQEVGCARGTAAGEGGRTPECALIVQGAKALHTIRCWPMPPFLHRIVRRCWIGPASLI